MSIFRACTRPSLISKRTGFLISGRLSRYNSNATTPSIESKADKEITIPPTRDVLVADVISGAPSMSRMTFITITPMLMKSQLSFVTVAYASTSPLEIPCKVVQANWNVGG